MVAEDRIDEWWNPSVPSPRFREASLGREQPKESFEEEALEKAPRASSSAQYEQAGRGLKGLR